MKEKNGGDYMKASDMCKIKALQERNTLNAQCRMISEMDFLVVRSEQLKSPKKI